MIHLFMTLATLVGLGGPLACNHKSQVSTAAAETQAAKPAGNRIEIAVTADGFVPNSAVVKVGQAVTLVVTRKVERTCAKEIVIKEFNINKPLPLNQPVEVTLTPTKPGKIRYACAMDMIAGELIAE